MLKKRFNDSHSFNLISHNRTTHGFKPQIALNVIFDLIESKNRKESINKYWKLLETEQNTRQQILMQARKLSDRPNDAVWRLFRSHSMGNTRTLIAHTRLNAWIFRCSFRRPARDISSNYKQTKLAARKIWILGRERKRKWAKQKYTQRRCAPACPMNQCACV